MQDPAEDEYRKLLREQVVQPMVKALLASSLVQGVFKGLGTGSSSGGIVSPNLGDPGGMRLLRPGEYWVPERTILESADAPAPCPPDPAQQGGASAGAHPGLAEA